MGVATVALIDTDSDPDKVDLPIPGNDDSIRSIELILTKLADAVPRAGRRCRPRPAQGPAVAAGTARASSSRPVGGAARPACPGVGELSGPEARTQGPDASRREGETVARISARFPRSPGPRAI